MKAGETLVGWWQPLPSWLKGITLLIAVPAWAFILVCIFDGNAKTGTALAAFCVFFAVTGLHIIFDIRNRKGHREPAIGLDIGTADD
ncbi:hypothetical protein [Sphingobium yanoikuyae]|uniref:hypothetical protein n=1 Tax=Sphingobium yanoikuyae TaxID=13690 RepID=UPI0011108E4B|nr:hypothetical protein [Sphingobium yanoikuyae]